MPSNEIDTANGNASAGLVESMRFSFPDGPTLNAKVWGDRSPTCILVHGFGEGAFVWNDFARSLAAHCQMVAPDLRGHGDSDWDPATRYSVDNHVDDLRRVIMSMGLQKILLIGHSMGGDIAIRIASETDKVVALVIVEYGPQIDPEVTAHIRHEFNLENCNYQSVADYVHQLGLKQPLLGRDALERMAADMLKPAPRGGLVHKRDPAMGREKSHARGLTVAQQWKMLERIKCPTLVVRGLGSSVLSREVAQRMMAVLPHGTLSTVPMAGHAVMRESPEGFEGATLPFIRSQLRTIASTFNSFGHFGHG